MNWVGISDDKRNLLQSVQCFHKGTKLIVFVHFGLVSRKTTKLGIKLSTENGTTHTFTVNINVNVMISPTDESPFSMARLRQGFHNCNKTFC